MKCLGRENKTEGRRFAGPVFESLAVDLDAGKGREILARKLRQPGTGLNAEYLEAASCEGLRGLTGAATKFEQALSGGNAGDGQKIVENRFRITWAIPVITLTDFIERESLLYRHGGFTQPTHGCAKVEAKAKARPRKRSLAQVRGTS